MRGAFRNVLENLATRIDEVDVTITRQLDPEAVLVDVAMVVAALCRVRGYAG